jgi:hypothetical protein
MLKITCTPVDGYFPAELHCANYSLGMLTDCHRFGCTKLGGCCHDVLCSQCWRRTMDTPYGCNVHNTLSLLSATGNSLNDDFMSNHALSCRHADSRLLLSTYYGLTPVAHILLCKQPRLSCHASRPYVYTRPCLNTHQRLWLHKDRTLNCIRLTTQWLTTATRAWYMTFTFTITFVFSLFVISIFNFYKYTT